MAGCIYGGLPSGNRKSRSRPPAGPAGLEVRRFCVARASEPQRERRTGERHGIAPGIERSRNDAGDTTLFAKDARDQQEKKSNDVRHDEEYERDQPLSMKRLAPFGQGGFRRCLLLHRSRRATRIGAAVDESGLGHWRRLQGRRRAGFRQQSAEGTRRWVHSAGYARNPG